MTIFWLHEVCKISVFAFRFFLLVCDRLTKKDLTGLYEDITCCNSTINCILTILYIISSFSSPKLLQNPTTLTNPLSSPTNHIRTRKAPASMASINQNLLYITLPEGSLRSEKKFFFPNREKFTFYPLGSLPGYYHFSLNRNCWVDDLYPLKRTWNFIQKASIFRRGALRVEICPSCHSRRRECRLFASGVNFSMNTNFVVILSLKLFRFNV